MPDTDKASGQNVPQETADELNRIQGHLFRLAHPRGGVFIVVIVIGEGDFAL